MQIRRSGDHDFSAIFAIINDAAEAYRGVIPPDRWHDPYMGEDALRQEIADGVVFWVAEDGGPVTGVMGIQDKGDVALVRHAYVARTTQRSGIGTRLLRHVESLTGKPILIGTWADASWAIDFYRRNGFRLITGADKDRLLQTYWSIPARQIETSVVLANARWIDRTRRPFDLTEAIAVLERTPAALDALLRGLPEGWIHGHEGGETWSPFDVIGHLIHGEKTDWLDRARIILEHGDTRPFDKFDRFAQFAASEGRTLDSLLDEFAAMRRESLRQLAALNLTSADLDRQGRHPSLGSVTLRQLLATWVAHDLDHIVQIARVMAKQYTDEVGPWRAYMRIISGQAG